MTADWYDYPPYVTARQRGLTIDKRLKLLRRDGVEPRPVTATGRTIAQSFWGLGWCRHLESFSDYSNRLPRGRAYVRHGAVLHLDITPGQVSAIVSGSALYNISIKIKPLAKKRWQGIRNTCGGRIGSMLELLQGRLSDEVMAVVADRDQGMYPLPNDISLSCDCPDWAVMCKHVAAVLYGVGARLDDEPGLLFTMRGVDAGELIGDGMWDPEVAPTAGEAIADDDLADVFGIELAPVDEVPLKTEKPTPRRVRARTPKKVKAQGTKGRSRPVFKLTSASIAELRDDYGLSIDDFAELVRVSAASVYRWETATKPLRMRGDTELTLRALESLKWDLWEAGVGGGAVR